MLESLAIATMLIATNSASIGPNLEPELKAKQSEFEAFVLNKLSAEFPNLRRQPKLLTEKARNSPELAMEFLQIKDLSVLLLELFQSVQILHWAPVIIEKLNSTAEDQSEAFENKIHEFVALQDRTKPTRTLINHLQDLVDSNDLNVLIEEASIESEAIRALHKKLEVIRLGETSIGAIQLNHYAASRLHPFDRYWFGDFKQQADWTLMTRLIRRASELRGKNPERDGLERETFVEGSKREDDEKRFQEILKDSITLSRDQWLELLTEEVQLAAQRLKRIDLFFYLINDPPKPNDSDSPYTYVLIKGSRRTTQESFAIARKFLEALEKDPYRELNQDLDRKIGVFKEAEVSRSTGSALATTIISNRIENVEAGLALLRLKLIDDLKNPSQFQYEQIDPKRTTDLILQRLEAIRLLISKVNLKSEDREILQAKLEKFLENLKAFVFDLRHKFSGQDSKWVEAFAARVENFTSTTIAPINEAEKSLFQILEDLKKSKACIPAPPKSVQTKEDELGDRRE